MYVRRQFIYIIFIKLKIKYPGAFNILNRDPNTIHFHTY